jgi:hypothetical protein
MHRSSRVAFAISAALAALALTACGAGAPNEDEVKAALSKQVDGSKTQTEKLIGKSKLLDEQVADAKKEIAGIKLLDCKADGEKAYVCDVKSASKAGRLRMVKGDDGWVAINQD